MELWFQGENLEAVLTESSLYTASRAMEGFSVLFDRHLPGGWPWR